jgi:enamine deaminase RidA (YjgF/YER057c/UK114 family)
MARTVDARLESLGIELPTPSTPGATYVPYVRVGDLLFLSGQLSQWNGERKFIGKLGRDFTVEEGQQAARLCVLNLIAHARAALDGDLDRVVRWVRVSGYVNCEPGFTGPSQVMNGASDLLVRLFGDAGRHTRMALGTNSLPYGVACEVEAILEVR